MSAQRPGEQVPVDAQTPETGYAIGRDEWVAQVERRRRRPGGLRGLALQRWQAIPLPGRIAPFALALLAFPPLTGTALVLQWMGINNNDFLVRIGATFVAFASLAIGLNVVVGYAGLLDLGYVAFFGLSGYAYAYLASNFVGTFAPSLEGGIHLPTLVSVPAALAVTALIGWLIGVLTLRLHGDYLAITTLGFGLVFVFLTTTLTRVRLPWLERPVDLTRGPNGISGLDDIVLFGFRFNTTTEYYYLFLALLALVALVVYHVNHSRIGRAWRAMRDDELATEVMGMPTRRLKVMAFTLGASIAGLIGPVFAAWQNFVAPQRYGVLPLIELYAMVVLGGIGSLPGVVLGALIFTLLPEILRSPTLAGWLFYGSVAIGLVAWLKPSRRLLAFVGGTVAGGLGLKLAVGALVPILDSGRAPVAGSLVSDWAQAWLVMPPDPVRAGNLVIIGSIFLAIATLRLRGGWWWVALAALVYLLVFAWETRFVTSPAVTRVIIIGTGLVTLMILRPQGILGRLEVRIV